MFVTQRGAHSLQLAQPGPLAMLGLSLAGLVLGVVSVTLAAWGPARRLSRLEPALGMKE